MCKDRGMRSSAGWQRTWDDGGACRLRLQVSDRHARRDSLAMSGWACSAPPDVTMPPESYTCVLPTAASPSPFLSMCRWPCSTPRSMPPCRRRLSPTRCPPGWRQSTASVATVGWLAALACCAYWVCIQAVASNWQPACTQLVPTRNRQICIWMQQFSYPHSPPTTICKRQDFTESAIAI